MNKITVQIDDEVIVRDMTSEEIAKRDAELAAEPLRQREIVRVARLRGYQELADPLFFKWQAGQGTEQEWLDARKQVDDDNPYPAK